MKKIFTLAAAIMLTAFSFAQYGHSDYSDRKRGYEKRMSPRDRQIQKRNQLIDHINYEYDNKIYWVQQSRMRLRDKKREINRLEGERQFKIRKVYAQFDGRNKRNYPYDHDRYVIH